MLSRIAEALYWIGRYVERADDTCRILDVHLQTLVEDPTRDEAEASAALLAVMGADPPDGPATSLDVLRILHYGRSSSPSVAASLIAARESARRAREVISPELWESINKTGNGVNAGYLRTQRPAVTFTWVRERCAIITGIADGTMSLDDSWHFMQLGRSLERVDMSTRLMASAAVSPSSSARNLALRGCGALHAFRRFYGAATLERDAAAFLLLDQLFPRSVVTALSAAEKGLADLGSSERRSGVEGEAARLLGKVRSELEYCSVDELMHELPARLVELQRVCRVANTAITRRYFEGALSPTWQGGEW